MSYKTYFLRSGPLLACMIIASASMVSAKEPVPTLQESAVISDAAVSELNGKLEGHYGRIADT